MFSICFCFCSSNNNSRTLSSAEPLKKKYIPKAVLKIRIEMIIEESKGFLKRDNNDKCITIYYNSLNKQRYQNVIEEDRLILSDH